MKIYRANLLFTPVLGTISVLEQGFIGVKDGKVAFVSAVLPEAYSDFDVENLGEGFLIPGFVDLHFHAPQFANYGLGFDQELLPWLNEYTFPEEAKFSEIDYARTVFSEVIERLVRSGTTRVVMFSSLHREATELLMEMVHNKGLGAYVGKVNMDRNSPEYLVETANESLEETYKWLENTHGRYKSVKPIITPRFVPTCTDELLEGLGVLAKRYNLPIQSHLSENQSECEWVKDLCPGHESYAGVYEHFGLMTPKTIMAHCIHSDEQELACFKRTGAFAAHCPNANSNLASGIMPIRRFLDANIPVGLGSDVGAGHQLAMFSVMAQAIQVSKLMWYFGEEKYKPLNLEEAFYLATKGGGAFFGQVGSFEVGYEFDALYINDEALSRIKRGNLVERLHRFVYTGDDRQIEKRFVSGKLI